MNGHTKPYKTYTLDGIKIGVYGLGIGLSGMVSKELYKETVYLDPYEIALDSERVLKEEEQCDLVICLSHLGYSYEANEKKPDDLHLAAKTNYTDLIIGGHTHTFLDKPDIVRNNKDKEVLVNQVGCFGINVGRIDFYFDSSKNSSSDGVSITV
jgi:5'-nucleotidase